MFPIVFLSIWTAGCLLFDGFVAISMLNQARALSYDTVKGTVTTSEVDSHRSSDGTTYRANVTYTYTVNGRAYTGDRVSYGEMSTSDREGAERFVADHPVGREVDVFVHPSNPEKSTLRRGVEGTMLAMVLFLTPFHVMAVGGWYMLVDSRRRSGRSAWEARLVSDDGARSVLRMTALRPVHHFFIGALASSFVGLFVVLTLVGFDVGPVVLVGALAVHAGAALAAYRRSASRLSSGIDTLEVDRQIRRLRLPRRRAIIDPAGTESVPFGQIADIRPEIDLKRHANGNPTYQLHLLLAGAPSPLVLAKWLSQSDALMLAAWLQQQVSGQSSPLPVDQLPVQSGDA